MAATPLGVVYGDATGRLLYANDRWLDITGRKLADVWGTVDFRIAHPDDRAALARELRAALGAGETWTGELRVMRPDGEVLHTRCAAAPVTDASGVVTGYVGTLEDVTEEVSARTRLERLTGLFASTPDYADLTDAEGRLLYLNPGARALFGIDPDRDVTGVPSHHVIRYAEWAWPVVVHEFVPTLLREGACEADLAFELPDGRELPMSMVAVAHRGPDGEVEYFSTIARDISDRKQAERRLSESEAWFRSLVQDAMDLVTVRDAQLRLVYASPGVTALLGCETEQLVGAPGLGLTHPEDRERVREAFLQALQGGSVDVHYRVRHRDGGWRVLESRVTNLLDDPVVRGLVTHSRDVTEAHRVEEAFRARAAADSVVAEILRTLVGARTDDVGARLTHALAELARFAAADAALLFVESDDPADLGERYGWHEPEVGPITEALEVRAKEGEDSIGFRSAYVRRLAECDAHAIGGFAIDAGEHRMGSVVLLWRERQPTIRPEELALLAVVGDVMIATLRRVRAEHSVHVSEERYRSLAAHSSDFVVVVGVDSSLRYLNPAAARFSGTAVGSSLLGRTGRVHPDDAAMVSRVFGDLGRAGLGAVSSPFEVRLRRADGEFRWIELIATNLIDDPVVEGIVVNGRDITERREAEDRLRESEARFRALVQNASDAITVLNPDATVRYSSPASERVLGYPEGWGLGADALDTVHPDDQAAVAEVLGRAFSEPGTHGPIELRVRHADGTWRTIEAIGNNLLADPVVGGVVVTARDVTERRAAEQAVREGEERLRALVQNLSDVITVVAADGSLAYSSPAAERLFGFEEGDESWTDPISRVHPDDVERVGAEMADRMARGGTEPVEFRIRIADDSWCEVEAIIQDLTEDPAVGGLVVTTRDVTQRKRAESLVVDQARVLRLIAQGAPLTETLETICRVVESQVHDVMCSILLLDEEAGVLRAGAAPSLPGEFRRAATAVPIGPMECSCGAAAFLGQAVVTTDIATDPRWERYRDLALPNGLRACWSSPIIASGGDRVLGTFGVFYREARGPAPEDEAVLAMVTQLGAIAIERKVFEDRLAHQAQHDPLTGLPNRVLFVEFLTLALARSRRLPSVAAVLFLDLDRFKVVNDSLGHDAGDALLVELSERLRSVLRPGDSVARFGGDEFTVLCDDLSPAEARDQVIEVAQRLLDVIEAPIDIEGEVVRLSASIGIAIAGSADTPEVLLRDADSAMYRAKELGKGRWELFDEEMRASARVRLETETALHRALERDELLVMYQPVIDLASRRCVGAEALVRWLHPERGMIGPDSFIGLAEEAGLIVPLGAWVLDEACRQAAAWDREFALGERFSVAVNLSARQLAQPDLVDQVGAALDRAGTPHARIGLEITESVLMAETTVEVVQALKALGVRMSIDDFGTGYSSLGYLKRFPVDTVKVDRSFVDGLGTDPEDSAIVAAVVSLGRALGLTVVAEGVETDRQLDELVALRCDQAQGFLFARPCPAADFEEMLRSGGDRLEFVHPRAS